MGLEAPATSHAPGRAALRVEDLCYAYGGRPALDRASFQVEKGTVCGLLGPNGSGKTTLFKCCLNFLRPSSGSVLLDGTETSRLSPSALAKRVSYVPQEHKQAFSFSVRDMARMGRTPYARRLLGLRRQDERLADEALERIGIMHLADIPCNRLSGGQRQLALIARAVAQGAPLMLLDEPTSALDFQNQIEVWNTLRFVAAQGVTVVVCCHDPNHILWFCDQVVLMKEGRTLASGAPASVFAQGGLSAVYGDICGHKQVDGLPVVYPRGLARV